MKYLGDMRDTCRWYGGDCGTGENCTDECFEECGKPCSPENACDDCISYWNRMRKEGFWIDGKGWTDKAIKEMVK